MCSADFRHPPIVLSILPSRRIHTFLKGFQGVAYTGKGSRETCRLVEPLEMIGPWGNCSYDDVFFCSLISSQWETHIVLVVGESIVKNVVIYEVWVKKTWGIPEGRLGTWKPYQEHQSWSWFTCSHVGKKKAMLTLCCSSALKRDYSENYHQIVPGLHHHFIRKNPLFLNSKNTDFQSWNTTQSDLMQTTTCASSAPSLR